MGRTSIYIYSFKSLLISEPIFAKFGASFFKK